MIEIPYSFSAAFISLCFFAVRAGVFIKTGKFSLHREWQMLFVYVCLLVVARFTFFPFSKVNGEIQPLLFSKEALFPMKVNMAPFVHLMNYPQLSSAILNLAGNTAMFIPVGIIWPAVFERLDTHKKVILAGIGFSLCIEMLQLPFLDRVSDLDDLILNTLGYLMGYGIFLLWKKKKGKKN